MTSHWARALLAVAMLTNTAHQALACQCPAPGPPCQAAGTASVVFTATVRAVEAIDHDEKGAPYRSTLVTLDVERGFVGALARSVEVLTGTGLGDCGYRFTVGRRYLVYGWKTESARLTTSSCSRTRPIEDAAEDLRYLRMLPAKPTGARIYGSIKEWRRDPAEERAVDYGPVEGVTVSVRGATFLREAVSDEHGRFEIANLPTGKVTLTVFPPPGFDTPGLEGEFDLPSSRACRVADFQLVQTARASGTVVDASGRPLAGVEVDAVAAELAGFAPPPYQQPVKTDARGVFEFEDLPPGTYVFGVNLTKRPGLPPIGQSVFLPGTRLVREATVVELKWGDSKDVGVLRLAVR